MLETPNLGAQCFHDGLVRGQIRIGGHSRALAHGCATELDDLLDICIIDTCLPRSILKIARFGIQVSCSGTITGTSGAVTGRAALHEDFSRLCLGGWVDGIAATAAAVFTAANGPNERRCDEEECEVFHVQEY